MALLENIKFLRLLTVLSVLVIVESQLNIPQYVMLDKNVHKEVSDDFIPMLFHDPRFPNRRPQIVFVP